MQLLQLSKFLKHTVNFHQLQLPECLEGLTATQVTPLLSGSEASSVLSLLNAEENFHTIQEKETLLNILK